MILDAKLKVKSVSDDKITFEMSDTAKLKKGAGIKVNDMQGC